MGSALAARLSAAGAAVVGFDVAADKRKPIARSGVAVASSLDETIGNAGSIVLCLPNSDVVEQVLSSLEPSLAAGSIILDTTTGDPEQVASFGPRLAARGVEYVDATVGGSSEQARQGEAIAMVGGPRESFERAKPLLETFARETFHLGDWGAGSRMKLVLNLVLGLNRAVLAEALVFAKRQGLDPQTALATLKAGPSYSTVMDVKGAKMLAEDFEPVARLSQHLKDVRLILAAGSRSGAKLPLSALHEELLERAERLGFGAADNCAVIKAFED